MRQQLDNNFRTNVDQNDIDQLLLFLRASNVSTVQKPLITALLLTGLDRDNHKTILRVAADKLKELKSCVLVNLHSRQCPNLQTALKNVIKGTIQEHSDAGTYNDYLAKHKRLLPLNSDLELLQRFTKQESIQRIIISLSDVENFDGSITCDLINTFYLWRQKIPFALILGITSTRELFERRLSKSCLKHINARTFDFAPRTDQDSNLLRAVQVPELPLDSLNGVSFGPSTMKALYDFCQGQGHTTQLLANCLKYLSMSHFMANPVSALSNINGVIHDRAAVNILASIARRTPSFKQLCENLVAENTKTAGANVINLLDDDDAILSEIQTTLKKGFHSFVSTSRVIYSFSDLYQQLSLYEPSMRKPRLEVEAQLYQAMDDLTNCQVFEKVRDHILSSELSNVKEVLETCETSVITVLELQEVLRLLELEDNKEPVLFAPNIGVSGPNAASPTTGAEHGKSTRKARGPTKVSRQKSKTVVSVVQNLINTLERKLWTSSLNLSSLLFHEAYVLSSRAGLLKQNFVPQPRAAIERALLKPDDYLTCDSFDQVNHTTPAFNGEVDMVPDEAQLPKDSRPPASILFALLQEAPTIINVRDLFDAFFSRLNVAGKEYDQTVEGSNSKTTMSLFYQALAELKMVGMVKASTGAQVKKRAVGGRGVKAAPQEIDFIAKTSWVGI